MKKNKRVLLLSLLIIPSTAIAGDWWTVNVTPQVLSGNYNGSPIRNTLDTAGGFVDFQYLERFGFAVGDTHLNLHYKNNIPTLHQDTAYFSVRSYLTPDALPGILTLRLDTYKIFGNDPTNETTDAIVSAPMVSFINYQQTIYLDLGYAYSKYGTSTIRNDNLSLSQITPTIGFSFNEKRDWLSARFYGIHSSNSIRSQNITNTFGSELTLRHYIIPSHVLVPEQVQLGVFVGQRMYAVDSNALVVYNLGDLQKNSFYLQAQWRVTPNINFLLNGGNLHFTTLYNNINYAYTLNYIFAGLNFRI